MFSVIIVVKNNKLGLTKTLSSVCSQSIESSKIQIIVIDGKSQDGTLEYCQHNNQIDTFISEDDSGIYNAMNKGIDYVEEDWVIFLNTGDIFYHDKVLVELEKYMLDHKTCHYICGNTIEIFHGQEKLRTTKEISEMPIHMPACHQSIVYQRDLLSNYKFNEEYKVCADLFQIASIIQDGYFPYYFDGVISSVEGVGFSNVHWRISLKERENIQRTFYNTTLHKQRLQKFHRNLIIKKYMRAFMPLKLQLFLRNKLR